MQGAVARKAGGLEKLATYEASVRPLPEDMRLVEVEFGAGEPGTNDTFSMAGFVLDLRRRRCERTHMQTCH